MLMGNSSWKFNNSLLKDIAFVNKIKETIGQTKQDLDLPIHEINNLDVRFNISDFFSFFETLLLNIRGECISCSSFKNETKEIGRKL